jgi:hypothetical protein
MQAAWLWWQPLGFPWPVWCVRRIGSKERLERASRWRALCGRKVVRRRWQTLGFPWPVWCVRRIGSKERLEHN